MPTLQRNCTVRMEVDDAERCWKEFTSQQGQSAPGVSPKGGDGQDPGTVYFNEAGKGKTEVTIQLDPQGLAEGDEKTLNERVDGFLQKFKQFVEAS